MSVNPCWSSAGVRAVASLISLGMCLFSLSARATGAPCASGGPRSPSRRWHQEWPAFSWIEGVTTATAGATTLVLALDPPPEQPRWRGGILFDDSVRSALRLSSPSARATARRMGDWPYYLSAVMPVFADPLVAWLAHDDPQAALNAELMAWEAFSYAGVLSFVSTRLSVRERPDVTECRKHAADSAACEPDNEAFWSGHTSIVAASAGIVCANHLAMPLWGSRAADAGACLLSSSAALLTAVSRLAADRHYTTDVLTGFGIGFMIGFGVPTVLHYGRGDAPLFVGVEPAASRQGALLSLAGVLE